MLAPYINVEIMNIFLEQFAKEIPEELHVVMVWDQAGYHTGKALQVCFHNRCSTRLNQAGDDHKQGTA